MTETDDTNDKKKVTRGDLQKEQRAQRHAAALRDNLRKRKTLQRAKEEGEEEEKKEDEE